MEERIQRQLRQQQSLPTHETLAAGLPPVPPQPVVTALLDTQVTVIAGAHLQSLPLANQTVGNARHLLQAALNIGPQAVALVNGHPVTPETVLHQGDTLEFVHEAGEKGVGEHGLWDV